MILVTQSVKERLLKKGVSTLHAAGFSLPEDCRFEPPCSMKWMGVAHSLHLGAFSYAVSGYYFATKIGRYSSIGESVQIGRGSHPVDWGTTSPTFYQAHEAVFDQTLPQAKQFRLNAPYLPPMATTIGNDVYIGHGAFLKQGITVGDGAIIGACSVVTRDVPPYSVVAGSPATVRRMRFSEPIIARMLSVRWWDYAFWDFPGIPVADPTAFLDFIEAAVTRNVQPYKPDMVDIVSMSEGAGS